MIQWQDLFNLQTLRSFTWRSHTLTAAGIGWLALATSILSSSTYSSLAKILSPAISPFSLVFVSELLVLAFVLGTFGALPIVRSCLRLSRKDIAWLLTLGCLNGLIGPGLWFTGLSLTTAVNAILFSKVEIVFLLVCATLLLRETITRIHLLAMCTIIGGVIIIALRGFNESIEQMHMGDFLIIASALSFGLGSVLCRKYVRHVQPHILLGARSITAISGFIIMMLFVPVTLSHELFAFPLELIPALIGFGFISRFINSVAFYEALERLPISTITLAHSSDIVLGTIIAYAMLGESIHWFHILGGCFIIAGTLLLELVGTHPTKEALEYHVRQRHR